MFQKAGNSILYFAHKTIYQVNSGTKESNYTVGWTVDRAFTVPLDASSKVTILPFTGQIAFNNNDYSDGGEVQFYSTALGVQAMENTFART